MPTVPAALLGLMLWGARRRPGVPLDAAALAVSRTLGYAGAALAPLALVRLAPSAAAWGGVHRDLVRLLLQPCDAAVSGPDRLERLDRRIPARGAAWLLERARDLCDARHAVGGRVRRARPYPALRAVAGAAIVGLVRTLYFTFSRGAWAALALGLVAMLALDPRRLQLSTTLAVVAPWPALAVWRASGSAPLTHIEGAPPRPSTLVTASLCTSVARADGFCLDARLRAAEARVRVPGLGRLGYVFVLLLGLVAASLLPVRYGSPVSIARHGYDSFMGQARPLRAAI